MNSYDYEDICVGDKESFKKVIKNEYINLFRESTGDINPLHCNNEYAQKKGYKERVVFGMLTASFYSTLVGVYLPGEKSVIYGIDISFKAPVYVGDELIVEGVVVEKIEAFKLVIIKSSIYNQNNECVSKAKIKVGVK